MKKALLIVFMFAVIAVLPAKERFSLDQVLYGKGDKIFESLPMTLGWADDAHYLQMKDMKLYRVDARSGKDELFLDPTIFASTQKTGLSAMQLLRNHTADWQRFAAVKDNVLYLYLRDRDELRKIDTGGRPAENPLFSPFGDAIAFTCQNDLYVYDIKRSETRRLTTDGSEEILNGYASWVYFEEILGRGLNYRAFWWSPDSRKIAFLRFDQSKVPVFPIVDAEGDYGRLEKQRYPKPGYPNPEVKLGIADLGTGAVAWITHPWQGEYYIAFPEFNAASSSLYFQWLNRDQDHFCIYAYDLAKKIVSLKYEEKQSCWIDFMEGNDFTLMADGRMLIRSSRSGWFHLYLVDGSRVMPMTQGEWTVKGIDRVNARRKTVFFTAAKEDSLETGYYRVDWNGQEIKRLTATGGSHGIESSTEGSFYLDRFSNITTPTRLDLFTGEGKLVRRIADTATPMLEKYDWPKVELLRIPTADGFALPALITRPVPMEKDRRYPVLINIYGGPGSASVQNVFPRGLTAGFLAQNGIISLAVDHRGSGHFGKKAIDLMHRNLGKWEMNDYIEAVKYLRTLPYVDPQKIAITGGSYGGYVAAMALTYGAEYFQFGLAHFSVIDWRLYDSVYTERYMDTPQENPDGYKNGSVLTYLDRYKGGLRITHGSMDDNVHMQNTIQFVSRVQDAGKKVELMVYPGERHGYRGKKGTDYQKWNLDFLFRNLLGRPLE